MTAKKTTKAAKPARKTTTKTPKPKTPKPKTNSAPDLSYIIEPLRQFAVPIDTLTLDPKNTRKHDKRNLDTIEASLTKYKQRQLIVVRKEGRVVHAGNGRVMAAQRMGWTHIAALVVDDAEADAVAFAIMDNRSAELAEWNYDVLPSALQMLVDTQGLDVTSLCTGFTAPEITDYVDLASLGNNPDDGREPARLSQSPKLTLEFGSKTSRDHVKAFVAQLVKAQGQGDKARAGDLLAAHLMRASE